MLMVEYWCDNVVKALDSIQPGLKVRRERFPFLQVYIRDCYVLSVSDSNYSNVRMIAIPRTRQFGGTNLRSRALFRFCTLVVSNFWREIVDLQLNKQRSLAIVIVLDRLDIFDDPESSLAIPSRLDSIILQLGIIARGPGYSFLSLPSCSAFMASTPPQFNLLPLRAYLFRLPLLTRASICLIFAIWILGVQSVWDMRQWGSLIPSEVGLTSSTLQLPRSSSLYCPCRVFRCSTS